MVDMTSKQFYEVNFDSAHRDYSLSALTVVVCKSWVSFFQVLGHSKATFY